VAKLILFSVLGCLGLAVAFAFYAAYRVTKLGQQIGRPRPRRNGSYIETTATPIAEPFSTIAHTEFADQSNGEPSAAIALGESIGSASTDFGGDSGGGDSGGTSD
jgi:hypothetical protein